jgi:DNA polymerase III epsilon subunit-like protein
MSDVDKLPPWAKQILNEVGEQATRYESCSTASSSATSQSQKALLLSETLAVFNDLQNMLFRWKFFVNASSVDQIAIDLEKERKRLIKGGFDVPAKPSKRLVNVLFIDTETTGVADHDQPISVGAILSEVNLNTGKIYRDVSSYYGLREPSCEIHPRALQVHGLSSAELKGKEFDIEQLVIMLGCSDMVIAHNASFDKRMLRFLSEAKQPKWACSMRDADWPPDAGGRSLDAICMHYGIHHPAVHNAITDTRAMMEALQKPSCSGKTHLSMVLERNFI